MGYKKEMVVVILVFEKNYPYLMKKLQRLPIKQRSRDRKNQIGTDDFSEKSLR